MPCRALRDMRKWSGYPTSLATEDSKNLKKRSKNLPHLPNLLLYPMKGVFSKKPKPSTRKVFLSSKVILTRCDSRSLFRWTV